MNKTNNETNYKSKIYSKRFQRNIFDMKGSDDAIHLNRHNDIHTFIGFLIFITVYVVLIPIVIIKYGLFSILEVYMPNVDLIANIISYFGNIIDSTYLSGLYLPIPITTIEFISQTTINYIALLGLTFLVARHTYNTKSITHGWSIALIMILMTYLLPGQYITELMNKIHFDNSNKRKIFGNANLTNALTIVIGIFATVVVVYGEKYILETFDKHIFSFAKYIMKLPKRLI